MTYQIYVTPQFERTLRKFVRAHPRLRQRISQILDDLERDPHQPHLRLHRLHDSLADFHAVRIDFRNRIVLTIEVREREITLHDIGRHDDVYR